MVPEERLDISEPKHVHSYGVIFQYGDAEKNVIVYEREAKFAERKSMPVSGTWLPRKHDFFSHFIFRLFFLAVLVNTHMVKARQAHVYEAAYR